MIFNIGGVKASLSGNGNEINNIRNSTVNIFYIHISANHRSSSSIN